ncbi:MAG: Rieske 2Fe-2S domain-containing protein [Actinomycetota bacterium]
MTAVATEVRLGPVDGIPPGEGRRFTVAGRDIAVFRLRDGRVLATDARCPHRGGPLEDGLVGMDVVVCPLHARRFSLVTGAADGEGCAVATHPVRVEGGDVVVALSAGEGTAGRARTPG